MICPVCLPDINPTKFELLVLHRAEYTLYVASKTVTDEIDVMLSHDQIIAHDSSLRGADLT